MSKATPKETTKKSKRALSVADILKYSPEVVPFEGEWLDAIGLPELKGAWLVFGGSGHGKTSFAMKLAKYFAKLGYPTVYDSIEEGLSGSIQKAIARTGMSGVSGFLFLDKEPISELRIRLAKKRSPKVIIIDSVQYTGLSLKEYKELIDDFPNKLFIFISHLDKNGKDAKGALAQAIYYDAFVCLFVQGFIAFVKKSRYDGAGEITISKSKAKEYWSVAENKKTE